MIKKFLARFGHGAATVDLRIENRPYHAGEMIPGEVHILGGEVAQRMNHLAIRSIVSVATRRGPIEREVSTFPIAGPQMIHANEKKVIPFTYQIPNNIPISRGNIAYFFDTYLEIEGGSARTDVDRFEIAFPKNMQSIFEALENLGFHEKPESGRLDQYGQEFSFFPTRFFAGYVNEVDLRFAVEENGIQVWMEVDCRHGYHELEAHQEFFLKNEDLSDVKKLSELFKQYITESSEHPQNYSRPFTYMSDDYGHYRGGSPFGGMIGGMAMGLFGSMLLSEMMGGFMHPFGFGDMGFGDGGNLDQNGFDDDIDQDDQDYDFFGGDGEDF